MSFSRRSLIAAALAAPAAHAGGSVRKRPTALAELWARTELYFGTNRLSQPPVTDDEFSEFVNRAVTERFPDGLTLLTAYGQFRNAAGELIREKSFLLILLYPAQLDEASHRIQEIRGLYKEAFGQESVLRVDTLSLVSF